MKINLRFCFCKGRARIRPIDAYYFFFENQYMYLVLSGALWSFVTVAPSPPDRACCLSSDKSFSRFSFSGSPCFESCGTDLCACGRLPEYVFFVTSTDFCFVPVSGFLDSEDWGTCCPVVSYFAGGCWVLLDVVTSFVCVLDS